MTSAFLVWQLADSAFPTGGFAHSGGLEAAWQLGEIASPAALSRFLAHALGQAGRAGLPFVTAAHAAPEQLGELDRLHDAQVITPAASRASRAQGRAWLAAAVAALRSAALTELQARCRREALPCHLPPVLGAVTLLAGLPRDEAQRLFLFQHLRGMVSAAVRLNVVGPMEAQSLMHRLGDTAEAVWDRCRDLGVDDAAQAAPLLDLFQAHHDRLYSRLFSS